MRSLLALFLSVITLSTFSQENKQSAFTFGYGHQFPIGDLAERFGNNSSIGCFLFSEKKNNLFYAIQGNYLFGGNVKDSMLFNNINTLTGAIIGADRQYANVNLMQRGFDIHLMMGYALHPDISNLSGFYFSGGIGFLQHQIFIDTKNQNIPQLNEEYKKGYDRLSNGVSTKWEAIYKYYSSNGKFQMYSGVNITLAYTKNRRPYLFDQMQYTSNETNLDKLIGVNFGIIIPIQRRNEEKFHYY